MIIEIWVRANAEGLVAPLEACIESLEGIKDYSIDTSGRSVLVNLDLGLRVDEAEFELGVTNALDACLDSLADVDGWSFS